MKWYQYLEDAKKINELWNSVNCIASGEQKRIEDYSISYFVETAKNLLDVMQYCADSESKKQTNLLEKYVEKYEIKNGQASINEWLKTRGLIV